MVGSPFFWSAVTPLGRCWRHPLGSLRGAPTPKSPCGTPQPLSLTQELVLLSCRQMAPVSPSPLVSWHWMAVREGCKESTRGWAQCPAAALGTPQCPQAAPCSPWGCAGLWWRLSLHSAPGCPQSWSWPPWRPRCVPLSWAVSLGRFGLWRPPSSCVDPGGCLTAMLVLGWAGGSSAAAQRSLMMSLWWSRARLWLQLGGNAKRRTQEKVLKAGSSNMDLSEAAAAPGVSGSARSPRQPRSCC